MIAAAETLIGILVVGGLRLAQRRQGARIVGWSLIAVLAVEHAWLLLG